MRREGLLSGMLGRISATTDRHRCDQRGRSGRGRRGQPPSRFDTGPTTPGPPRLRNADHAAAQANAAYRSWTAEPVEGADDALSDIHEKIDEFLENLIGGH